MKQYKHKITGDVVNHSGEYYSNGVHTIPALFVEKSNDWEEIKPEYPKILAFKNHLGDIATFNPQNKKYLYKSGNGKNLKMMLKYCQGGIYQVATSPTDIWTIGDRVKYKQTSVVSVVFTIDNFFYDPRKNRILARSNDGIVEDATTIELVKNPLFTTEDQVQIYELDEVYYVRITIPNKYSKDVINTVCRYNWLTNGERSTTDNYKWFSTKEAGERYVELNKLRYSIQQIEDAIKESRGVGFEEIRFRQKLGI